jgi:hypothetical protein
MALNLYLNLTANGTALEYRVDDIKLNGRPVRDLQGLNAPGRLEFVAVPQPCQQSTTGGFPTALRVARDAEKPAQPAIVGGFKSLSGMSTEMEIGDPRHPGERRAFAGRVLSVAPSRGYAQAGERVTVTCDKPQNRRVTIIPAEN